LIAGVLPALPSLKRDWIRDLATLGPDIFFVGLLSFVTAARWVILSSSSVPPGVDEGNWLAFGHALTGEHIRASSITYPPVVPLLMVGASWAWGPLLGAKVVGVMASVCPAAAVYSLLRSHGLRWKAALCAGLLAPASSTGEALAWGGYPQLIGLALLVLFLWSLDRFMRSPQPRRAAICGILLFLVLATSELVGGFAVVAGAALVALHLVIRPAGRVPVRGLLFGLAWVLLPSLLLVPLYVSLRPVLAEPPGQRLRWPEFLPAIESLYREFRTFWRTAVLLGVSVPLILIAMRRTTLLLITTTLLLVAIPLLVVSREIRSIYFWPIMAIIGLGCWLQDRSGSPIRSVPQLRRVLSPVLAVALGTQVVFGLSFFRQQVDYYTYLSPGFVQGMAWLQANTSPDTLVAVSPSRGNAPLGWWVEGMGRRRTIYGSDLRWLGFPDERSRAMAASRIFDSSISISTARARAQQLGAEYILVDKDWSGFLSWSQSGVIVAPTSVVLDNESLLLLRTNR
jgi:hypothetical protein